MKIIVAITISVYQYIQAVKKSSSCDAFSETWQTKDSTLHGACNAALGASSLLGASTSYGPVELISLLPRGWMALQKQMKAVHWGFPSELVMLISKELMRRTSMKQPSFPKQCVYVVICNLPRLAVSCFFLVRKFQLKACLPSSNL